MVTMHTVKHGRTSVHYSAHVARRINGISLRLPNYKQQDTYSCGFVAALTVVKYLKPEVSDKEVLVATRPSINWGINRINLARALEALGIRVGRAKDLTVRLLRRCVANGMPVIVSVWPEDWVSDHWTVVQGFDNERVYLTNHYSMSVKEFMAEWSDMDMRGQGGSGEGFVCV